MTDKELILREMWEAGAPIDEIAARIGTPRDVVYQLRKAYGIPDRLRQYQPRNDPTPTEIAERAAYCRRMREAGTPVGGA